MSTSITYIRVLQAIESFASEHLQIKKFGSDFPEQLPNFGTSTEEYPILFVSPSNGIFDVNVNTFDLTISCFDIIQKDRGNINEILSDTNSILNDLKIWLREGEIAGIDVIGTPSVNPINNSLLDYVAGWEMSITLEVTTYGICEIPFDNSPAVSEIVNGIVYSKYLTCESLENCSTFSDLENRVEYLEDNSIPEAPIDDNQYTRFNGTWSVINTTPSSPSQLELITEGIKTGWRLYGKNPANYGNTGNRAVDFSNSTSASSIKGSTGDDSITFGVNNTNSGEAGAVVFGESNNNNGGNANAIFGIQNTANNGGCLMAGSSNTIGAGGNSGVVFGSSNTVNNINSIVMGQSNTANARYSSIFGQSNTGNSFAETVIGNFASSLTASSANAFVSTDTIFRVGVGVNGGARADGFRVYKNSSLYLNPVTQASVTNAIDGLLMYNTTTKRLQTHNGTTWSSYALTSDVIISDVWNKSGMTAGATNSTDKIYRRGTVNIVGSDKFFSTGPSQADIDNEILGTNFGHISPGGGTVPFIQLLSNHGNGPAGTNHFIGRYVGADANNPQMNFSAIKSTNYDAWGDAGRVLFRFKDGYLAPQNKFDIGTDYLKFHSYPSTRNDSSSAVNNLLFTDTTGGLKSKPIASVLDSRNGTNSYFSDFVEQGDFRVNNVGYKAAQVYYGGTGNENHPGQIIHYLDNINSIGITFINFGWKSVNQVLDFVYMVDTTQSYLNTTIGCGINTGVVDNDDAYYFHIIGNTVSAVTSNSGVKTTVSLGNLANGDINNGVYYHYRISVLATNSIKFDVYQMNGTLVYTTTITTNIVPDLKNNMSIGVKTYITSGTPSITPVYMARFDYISVKYNTIKQRGAV